MPTSPAAGRSAEPAPGLPSWVSSVTAVLKDKDEDNDLASTDVLPNPYHERVTLVRDFLKVPYLDNVITDSHFAKRDRMGRTLGFLSRLVRTAGTRIRATLRSTKNRLSWWKPTVKLRWLDRARVLISWSVTAAPEVCKPNVPLTIREISAYRAPTGAHFDLKSWKGDGGEAYSISVENGVVRTSRQGNAVY